MSDALPELLTTQLHQHFPSDSQNNLQKSTKLIGVDFIAGIFGGTFFLTFFSLVFIYE